MPQAAVKTQVYEVTAPDGTVLEVTGPAGAPQEEVIRQAQLLYKPKPKESSELDQIRKDQAAKFPSSQELGKGGAGVQDKYPRVNEFMTELEGDTAAILRAPFEDPIGTAKGIGKTLIGAMNPADLKSKIKPVQDIVEPAWTMHKTGNTAGALGKLAAPIVAAAITEGAMGTASGVRSGIRAAANEVAPSMYQKALQPSPRTYSAGEIREMAETGLKNKIPVSKSGLNRLDTLVNDLNKSIEADIQSNPNAPVNAAKVESRLRGTEAKVANQVNPESDIAAVREAGQEFLRTQPADIPAATAQELKKGTYRQVGDKAMGGEVKAASVKAQKALAKGLKEELEGIFPEIKVKNAAEGKLLDLRPELEAAVNRLGNRRISLANVVNILADPAITSRIAIYVKKLGIPPSAVQQRIASAIKIAVPAAVATQPVQNRREARERLGQPTP